MNVNTLVKENTTSFFCKILKIISCGGGAFSVPRAAALFYDGFLIRI
jgi:hypothetical protein